VCWKHIALQKKNLIRFCKLISLDQKRHGLNAKITLSHAGKAILLYIKPLLESDLLKTPSYSNSFFPFLYILYHDVQLFYTVAGNNS
jgi:hypothetical protein